MKIIPKWICKKGGTEDHYYISSIVYLLHDRGVHESYIWIYIYIATYISIYTYMIFVYIAYFYFILHMSVVKPINVQSQTPVNL